LIRKFITRFFLFHFILLGVVGLIFAQSGQYFPLPTGENIDSNFQSLTPGSIAIIITDDTSGKTAAGNPVEAIPEYEEEDTSNTGRKHLKSIQLFSFICNTSPWLTPNSKEREAYSLCWNSFSISMPRQHLVLQVFRI
jgi:hypothetical protein